MVEFRAAGGLRLFLRQWAHLRRAPAHFGACREYSRTEANVTDESSSLIELM